MAAFGLTVRAFVDRALSPEARSALLARTARREVAALVAAGRAAAQYDTLVDGREGVPEEAVRPDGRILYRFNPLAEAVRFAFDYCVQRSPVRSGRYKGDWVVLVNGRAWSGGYDEIPPLADVFITNRQPYHRKIDTGAIGPGAAGRLVASRRYRTTSAGNLVQVQNRKRGAYVSITEGARQAGQRAFPLLSWGRAFITLPGGYTLRSGKRMTYPAVTLSARP
jgi:hypothetical protein